MSEKQVYTEVDPAQEVAAAREAEAERRRKAKSRRQANRIDGTNEDILAEEMAPVQEDSFLGIFLFLKVRDVVLFGYRNNPDLAVAPV